MPALRERPHDIDTLIDHFLLKANARLDSETRKLSPEARALLLRYDWPGNVRQLRNTLDRIVIMAHGSTIVPDDIPDQISGAEPQAINSPLVSLAEVEKAHILRVLDHMGGNKKGTAEMLGIDRSTLYAKLRSYGLM